MKIGPKIRELVIDPFGGDRLVAAAGYLRTRWLSELGVNSSLNPPSNNDINTIILHKFNQQST